MMRHEEVENAVAIPKYVWWDMESCKVPDGCDPSGIRWIIESALVKSYGPGPLTIFAIGNSSRVPHHVLEALSRSGIIIKHSVIGVLSVVTDLHCWVNKHTPPAILMVISDLESNFQDLLLKYESRGFTIARAYLNRPPESPEYTCNEWFWESLLTQETTRQELQGKCNDTTWYCNLCFKNGQGFEDFTSHFDTGEHAFKDMLLLAHTSRMEERSMPPQNGPQEPNQIHPRVDKFKKWLHIQFEPMLKRAKERADILKEMVRSRRCQRRGQRRREKRLKELEDPVKQEMRIARLERRREKKLKPLEDPFDQEVNIFDSLYTDDNVNPPSENQSNACGEDALKDIRKQEVRIAHVERRKRPREKQLKALEDPFKQKVSPDCCRTK